MTATFTDQWPFFMPYLFAHTSIASWYLHDNQCANGKYRVHLLVPLFDGQRINAVMDDFGNLVRTA